MQVSSLVIEMAANVGRLQNDMAQARRAVDRATGGMNKAVDVAKKALIGLAAAFSVNAVKNWVKSSLEAMDAMSKLSQRAGVAVKEVGGLQLAFRQSGLSAGALESSMARLNRGIADGNKAFEAMGVSTKNADGSLKSARQMLGEVADQFAKYEDGAAKAALAQEIFGRTGAEMIPLLNGGSQALDDFDAMAKKLGLTLDEETARSAEKFNDTIDLMGQGMKGVGMQVAGQILPTLQTLADKLFGAMTAGDRLANVTKVLSFALKILGTAAIALIEIVSMLSRSFSTFATMARQALTGDFAGAMETYKSGVVANFNGVRESLSSIGELWTETGNSTVAAVAGANKAMREQAPVIRDAASNQRSLANQTRNLAEQQKRKNKELDAYFEAEEKSRQAKENSIRSARELVEQIEFETAALKMTNTEREIAIRLRDLERKGIQQGSREYEIYAQKIRESVTGRETVRASIEAQRQAREGWEKTWDQVAQSMTDALMQGGQSVKQYLQNLFRTMVLRPLLQPIIAGGAGMMGSVANAMGFGPDSGGIGSTMNLLSGVRSAYQAISGGFASLGNSVAFAADSMGAWLVNNTSGMLNQMGGSLMQSAGALGTAASAAGGAIAGFALQSMISGGYSINKNLDTFNKIGIAAASAIMGPIGGVIVGIGAGLQNRLFGRKAPQTTGEGLVGTFSTEGASLQAFQEWHAKGGVFRSSKSGVNYSAISSELDQFLDSSLIQITQATRMYAQILGLNADAVNGVTQSVRISLRGLNAEQQQEAIMRALGGFGDRLAQQFDLSRVQHQGETAGEALSRLANSLVAVNQVLGTLNQTLLSTSLASGSAASALLDIFGGTEEFAKATTAYYQAFYTEAERTAKATQQLTEVLASMGFALPATRAEFRALVEAQDLMTHAGRQNYAALLRLSTVFDEITPKLDTLAGQLGSLLAGLLSGTIDDVTKQITLSRRAGDQARQAAQAFAFAGQNLRQTATELLGLTRRDGNVPNQYRAALAAAMGGDLKAMEALPDLARSMQTVTRSQAVTSVDAALASAKIAAELAQVAAVADVMEIGADYQAKLYDVNTAMLEVLRTTLQSGNATVETLREQLVALEYMGVLISNSNTGLHTLEGRAKEQIDITDIVAMATGTNAQLSNAILNQLQIPDAGSEFLARTVALGNDFIAGRLDGVIAAINKQTADQQAEIKRQQDLQKAQAQLEALRDKQALAISQVQASSQAIFGLASRHGVFLNAQKGPVQMANTASFGVNDQGLFQAQYNQISFSGSAQKAVNFRNEFYAPGGVYDQTYGRAAELRQLAADLEAQREAIRALGGVPQFAVGTNYVPKDMLAMVHEGEAIVPKAYNPEANLQSEKLMKDLIAEVGNLRAEVRSGVAHTHKIARTLDRVTPDGDAIAVRDAV